VPVSVYHALTATTPDDPRYEIRPIAHWNASHLASLSATAGTEIYGAFSNDPAYNVSFSTNPGGQVVASANVTAAPSPVNVTGNGSSVNAQTIAFTNANGLTLGVSTAANAATITGSYTVPSTAGLISAVNVSAGTTSNNLSAITFSNSNGLAFGLNGSTLTGSYTVPTVTNSSWTVSDNATSLTVSRLAFTQSNGLTLSLSTGAGAATVIGSYTVPSQTNQTAGIYASSQTYGQSSSSTYDARSLTVVGSGDVSIGWSAGSLLVSGSTYPAASNSSWTVSDAATSGTVARLAFTNLNGVTLSLSTGAGGSHTVVGSVAPGGAFSAGASNVGNTAGNTGITGTRLILAGGNNITVSQGTDANGATITISGANAGGAQTGVSSIAASGGTQTVGMVSFANSNGMTFGMSTGANTGTMTASYTVPTVTNSSWTVSDANTSGTVALLAFTQSNGLTLSLSTSNNGHHTLIGSYTVPTQTNQTLSAIVSSNTTGNTSGMTFDARSLSIQGYGIASVGLSTTNTGSSILISATQSNQAFSAQGGSSAFQTLSFTNSNNVSFSNTNGSIWGSYALNVSATGGTSNALSGLTFKDSNGVSFGLSTGAGVGTLTATVAAQSVQTLGIYASSNTLGTTSSTYDARSLSFVGSGVASVGWSNGSWVINAPAAGGDGVNVVSMATTTSGGQTSGTTYSQSSGTIGLVAGSNITLQQSSNSIVIFGASGGAGGNMSLYANGNTTVSSSIGSIPPTSFSLGGYGAASVGYSSTNTTGIGTIIISAPATSSLVGTNGISVSTNGSTISVQPQFNSSYENINQGLQGSQTLTFNAASVSYGVAFMVPYALSASFIRIPALMTTNSTTIATLASATASASGAIYSTFNAVVYSLGNGGSSQSLQSVASGSGGYTFRNSISISNSTQASYTLGFSAQALGGGTTLTTQYSISNTNYSFTTNQIATNFSSLQFIDVPFANSLTPGAYWLILGLSTSSASGGAGGLAAMTNCNVRYSNHYGISQANSAWGVMGSTNLTSGGLLGAGSFSTAAGGTTASLPLSAISSGASNIRLYFQMLRSN